MGEYLLRWMLDDAGIGDAGVRVTSGGVGEYARSTSLVSLDTKLTLADLGLTVPEGATARALKREFRPLLGEADLILTMTTEHVAMVRSTWGGPPPGTLIGLREFAGLPGEIDDPAGQEEDVFAATRDRIAHSLRHSLWRLIPGHAPVDPARCTDCLRA